MYYVFSSDQNPYADFGMRRKESNLNLCLFTQRTNTATPTITATSPLRKQFEFHAAQKMLRKENFNKWLDNKTGVVGIEPTMHGSKPCSFTAWINANVATALWQVIQLHSALLLNFPVFVFYNFSNHYVANFIFFS